jgi:pimeloyl-ACP methyl ester carboxylesterase
MSNRLTPTADFVEAGHGPLVVLAHASMSNARQWSGLVEVLDDRFRLRALNLIGYGRTPAWDGASPPTLDDYADVVLSAIPPEAEGVTLIGHSFGGAVAMQAARRLGRRAARLVLIEPSIFSLLRAGGRHEAFAEIAALPADMRRLAPEAAAERFIGYWIGAAGWAATPLERKAGYARQLGLALHELGAAFADRTTLREWAEALPARTLILCAGDTTRPSREVVELLSLAGRAWEFARVPEGGHMSPLTRPALVNGIIAAFLDRPS